MTAHDREPVVDSPTGWVADHIRGYVETDGEEGHLFMGFPTLLLTTRGHRSGKRRRTALIYGEDSGRLLLVASNGGSDTHPAWYLNLREHPEVEVQVRADRFTATARTASPEKRPRLWDHLVGVFPQYAEYQQRTDRTIPVVVLERTDRAAP
ncbi:nitroreductase family deazaflavin-dependent oxidoreductase [Streptomonospora nanhaiensis]|uniref:nitroreductase family deazaflavin-dependent oxidoreductase n=1 Tax=Streptomonospora nanhaiensis TaxID=1323731 RepID=UPI001C990CE0|nr:nitroreductase family deazaflavin-dependent oxidoreductase [Streptomonospora nanhaiensis]MBX9388765.1 nitroreductase family deazaflavin-dependent oxidoreductase [Streptomonospora nanhaiensis]